MKRAWQARICEGCGKSFEVRDCYLKRPHNAGRFCSIPCRKNKPQLSELAKKIGRAPARAFRQKCLFQETRLEALSVLSGPKICCENCGCDVISVLEVNHINGGGSLRKESGVRLWRLVITLAERAKEFFNVRCKICNQLEYVERCFAVRGYKIIWSSKE